MFRTLPAAFLATVLGALAQTPTPSGLPPSEELKVASAPFLAARAQPGDLTEADLAAFAVGVSRAAKACENLDPTVDDLAKQPAELLALGQLCLFGQQYAAAKHVVERYLKGEDQQEREKAQLFLTKAFLGLKDEQSATTEILLTENGFPYDAQIHAVANQVILSGSVTGTEAHKTTLAVCNEQLNHTLPSLEGGQGISGKAGTASPGQLFADAVRCLDIARTLDDSGAQSTAHRLRKILHLPAWQRTAELSPMSEALARSEMVGTSTPVTTMQGQRLRYAEALEPLTISLSHSGCIFIPFTIWASSIRSVVSDLQSMAPNSCLYLITSWAANSGGADRPSDEQIESLRSVARRLPAELSIVIVRDTLLQAFDTDVFPAAIVVRDGIVRANLPLAGDATERLALVALGVRPIAQPEATLFKTP